MPEKGVFIINGKEWTPPEGALPGQFCRSQIITVENPDGTDCTAHLAYGRIMECPFSGPDEATTGIAPDGRVTRICADFALRDFGPDADFTI